MFAKKYYLLGDQLIADHYFLQAIEVYDCVDLSKEHHLQWCFGGLKYNDDSPVGIKLMDVLCRAEIYRQRRIRDFNFSHLSPQRESKELMEYANNGNERERLPKYHAVIAFTKKHIPFANWTDEDLTRVMSAYREAQVCLLHLSSLQNDTRMYYLRLAGDYTREALALYQQRRDLQNIDNALYVAEILISVHHHDVKNFYDDDGCSFHKTSFRLNFETDYALAINIIEEMLQRFKQPWTDDHLEKLAKIYFKIATGFHTLGDAKAAEDYCLKQVELFNRRRHHGVRGCGVLHNVYLLLGKFAHNDEVRKACCQFAAKIFDESIFTPKIDFADLENLHVSMLAQFTTGNMTNYAFYQLLLETLKKIINRPHILGFHKFASQISRDTCKLKFERIYTEINKVKRTASKQPVHRDGMFGKRERDNDTAKSPTNQKRLQVSGTRQ